MTKQYKKGNYKIIDGKKMYGPYEGSAENGGRKHYVEAKKDGSRTTSNAARVDKEHSTGRKLRKDEHVDHKDNNRKNDSPSNTRVTSRKENIGKENKRRAGK
jgi:hypothetical protein